MENKYHPPQSTDEAVSTFPCMSSLVLCVIGIVYLLTDAWNGFNGQFFSSPESVFSFSGPIVLGFSLVEYKKGIRSVLFLLSLGMSVFSVLVFYWNLEAFIWLATEISKLRPRSLIDIEDIREVVVAISAVVWPIQTVNLGRRIIRR